MKLRGKLGYYSLVLILLITVGDLSILGINTAYAELASYVPLKWAVIVMGGFDYHRDLTFNAIQRIEKILQGRGVPFDIFQDDAVTAPSDNPPPGQYSLQYNNGTLKYQVLVLLFDYEPQDSTAVSQSYIYWAVGNGTNAVLFNKAAIATPELLGLTSADITWSQQNVRTTNFVYKTFDDGIKEHVQGSNITLGVNLNFHTLIRRSAQMAVWFNKTWTGNSAIGMANTTYHNGIVWYLGYSLNEYAMEYSALRYQTSWADWRMDFWGHSINFVFNSAQKIDVGILAFKRWKGAWILRIDTDSPYWKTAFLPPESALQSGWVYDYQYCVLGYARATSGTSDLLLTAGAPSGYVGIPSSNVMHTRVTGVLQSNYSSKDYQAIIYNSTADGDYDRIRLDFNENMNFSDDIEYRMWENMTHPGVLGKLYWNKLTPDFSQPTQMNIGWWQTPMLVQDEAANLPQWRRYGADYGLTYSFHGWQHVRLEPEGSSYSMWNGTRFLLNTTYIEEKFNASRYWMKEKFGGSGYGFEEDQVVISHPFNSHPAEVDEVISNLPWVLLQYDGAMAYVGFGDAGAKYTLASANEELFSQYSRFAVLEDMVKTLYPVVSTFTHGLSYNLTFLFPPYSDSVKPTSARDAFQFWINSKDMLENMHAAFYKSGKITLEFEANSALEDFVWRFPKQLEGQEFSNLFDNRSIGQIKHTDADYVYIEFSQGQGPQKLEVNYDAQVPIVTVTVFDVYPPNSGLTDPAMGTYAVSENTVFSISATPFSGYVFDHWELDGVDVGSANPYSFNVGTSSHTISAFFAEIPTMPSRTGTSSVTSGTRMFVAR